MSRTLPLILSVLVLSGSLYGQQKAREAVSDQYDRNGLATILVKYGDGYDSDIDKYFKSIDKGSKFDLTGLPQTSIKASHSRGAAAEVRSNGIDSAVGSIDYGKEIVAWLYSRTPDGRMDPARVLERGHFNATEEDLARIESTKMGRESLGDIGFQLMANNYVLFIDYWSVKRTSDNNGDSWSVSADGYLYKINYDATIEQNIFDCWIYDDDSPEVKSAKQKAWENLVVGISRVMVVSTKQSYKVSDGGLSEAVKAAYAQLIFQLEKGNDDWMVKASIYDRKPLRAKIGTKEGLKNGQRFDVYRYSQDRHGRIVSTRKGIVRATTIADNNRVVDREAPMSEFYQIAGPNVSEGMILRQRNDLGMSVSAGYRYGGLNGANVKIDYLANINTRGTSHYALIDLGLDMYRPKKYFDKHGGAPEGDIPNLITAFDVGIGYGVGFRATRFLEVMPHILGGADFLFSEDEIDDSAVEAVASSGYSLFDKAAWFVTGGVRFNINVYYPVQLYAGADYTVLFLGESVYSSNDKHLEKMGMSRHGLGFVAGVRVTF